jgi:hypothetical protein
VTDLEGWKTWRLLLAVCWWSLGHSLKLFPATIHLTHVSRTSPHSNCNVSVVSPFRNVITLTAQDYLPKPFDAKYQLLFKSSGLLKIH